MKLAAAPWTFNKIRKRVAKQVLWISFAFLTGLTFVGYFEPIRQLVPEIFSLELNGWALFWVLFYGFATYGNAGFMREQVCKYMCPYARFQSAMFDQDTLIVAYDEKRGEPRSRGKKRKVENSEMAAGDCIDCGICVQVCPTGIDIRDGLQYECIACAACIDGCDTVMEQVGLPTGLIKYSTQAQDRGSHKSLRQILLRPRVLIYGALLSLVFGGFVVSLASRSSFQVDILRDRNALFRWSEDNQIENIYQVKVMNKSQLDQAYAVAVTGLYMASVRWAKDSDQALSREVKAGEIGEFTAIVSIPQSAQYDRSQEITFEFREVNGDTPESVVEETKFWGPPTGR
jgi:cytochrome c oxidase accessory protein FixG